MIYGSRTTAKPGTGKFCYSWKKKRIYGYPGTSTCTMSSRGELGNELRFVSSTKTSTSIWTFLFLSSCKQFVLTRPRFAYWKIYFRFDFRFRRGTRGYPVYTVPDRDLLNHPQFTKYTCQVCEIEYGFLRMQRNARLVNNFNWKWPSFRFGRSHGRELL